MSDSVFQIYTYEVLVRGYVQGVGYRAFVFREANRLGVSGWVRNEPDGAVRALLQHSRTEVLEALVERMKQGPMMAVVQDCEVRPVSTEERFTEMNAY